MAASVLPGLPAEPGSEPAVAYYRLAAVQPVSRSVVRFGILWLVVAAMALAGCNSNVPLPLVYPMVTVQMHGGLCADGGVCDHTVILERDGRVHSAAKPPNDLGQADPKAMAALAAAIQATDWVTLRSHPFTGECPIAFDGQELVFEFGAGAATQRIASCEVAIDWGSPLFMALGVALGRWVPLPLT